MTNKTNKKSNTSTSFESPLGWITLKSTSAEITEIAFSKSKSKDNSPVLDRAKQELLEYFTGKRTDFSVPIHPQGTPFQKKVWNRLRRVRYGKVLTYGQLAIAIGHPKSSRAVGNALGKNPIPVILPCHRVVRRNSGLGGFSSGIAKKKWLLNLEEATF